LIIHLPSGLPNWRSLGTLNFRLAEIPHKCHIPNPHPNPRVHKLRLWLDERARGTSGWFDFQVSGWGSELGVII